MYFGRIRSVLLTFVCRGRLRAPRREAKTSPTALPRSEPGRQSVTSEGTMYLILDAESIAPDVRRIVVQAPKIAKKHQAGQFVIVRVTGSR